MPRGGSRVGSGRKPKENVKPFAPVVHRGGADAGLAAVPDDLPDDQVDFWRRYASLAVEQGTLTTHTVPSFRLLCEQDAIRQKRALRIADEGETYIKCTIDGSGSEHKEYKAHPLTGPHDRAAKHVEALMARFKLAPFGKPEIPHRKKTTQASPWARVAGK